MNRKVWAGVALAFVLVGCSSDPAETESATATPVTTTTAAPTPTATTTIPTTTTTPPAETEAPAPAPEAAEAPAPAPADVPAVPASPDSEMPHGEQLYLETCQRFVAAIDGLAATGAASREQSATGISDQLQSNPSWSTLPAEDQQEILRGLTAAENGSC